MNDQREPQRFGINVSSTDAYQVRRCRSAFPSILSESDGIDDQWGWSLYKKPYYIQAEELASLQAKPLKGRCSDLWPLALQPALQVSLAQTGSPARSRIHA